MQAGGIYSNALALGNIHHGEGHNNRHLQVHDLGAEKEVPFEIGGVGNDNNEIGSFGISLVQQYLVGDLFIGTLGVQAIGARQVDDIGSERFGDARGAGFLIDRNTGEVAHLLVEPRKRIEEGTLTAVGISDECYSIWPVH